MTRFQESLPSRVPGDATCRFWMVVALLLLTSFLSAPDLLAREELIRCPVAMVETKIVTPLPAPWWETPQKGGLETVEIKTIGGDETLVCGYWAYGETVSVMRKFPEWANQCEPSKAREGFMCSSSEKASTVCRDAVQGKIAWNYTGSRTWAKANVERLCEGAEDTVEPAHCFRRVMHGEVDWGGGTKWEWANAIDLCAGTRNARATVACFEDEIQRSRAWRQAIDSCKSR